jgi:hypothetical protein
MQGQQRKVERRIVGGAQAQDSRPGFSGLTCQSSALTTQPGKLGSATGGHDLAGIVICHRTTRGDKATGPVAGDEARTWHLSELTGRGCGGSSGQWRRARPSQAGCYRSRGTGSDIAAPARVCVVCESLVQEVSRRISKQWRLAENAFSRRRLAVIGGGGFETKSMLRSRAREPRRLVQAPGLAARRSRGATGPRLKRVSLGSAIKKVRATACTLRHVRPEHLAIRRVQSPPRRTWGVIVCPGESGRPEALGGAPRVASRELRIR